MKFKLNNFQFILLLVFSLCCVNCSNETTECYSIGMLNLSTDSPRIESVFYEFSDPKIIEQIVGDSIVANVRETKIEKIIILRKLDTIDTSSFSRIKKIENGIHLINRSPRFIGLGDSVVVMNKIKEETLVLTLKNGKNLKFKICN